jgi:hypothetical protein
MKSISTVGKLVLLMLLTAAGSARAATIFDVTSALTLADPTQLGRLSRNAIPQDWAGGEPFPGVINTTTTYHYHEYVVNVGLTPFIQIEVDSVSANTFFSAYDTTYAPDSAGSPNLGFDINWLGDAGTSGNFFGVDPIFFQVLVPQNHNLVVVVNNTPGGVGGIGDPFHLTVEGFIDSEFTEPGPTETPVPEPATMLLTGGGMAFAALRRRFQRRQ